MANSQRYVRANNHQSGSILLQENFKNMTTATKILVCNSTVYIPITNSLVHCASCCVQVGKQQQYQLGKLLKKRYVEKDSCGGLICSNYTREQVSTLMASSPIHIKNEHYSLCDLMSHNDVPQCLPYNLTQKVNTPLSDYLPVVKSSKNNNKKQKATVLYSGV